MRDPANCSPVFTLFNYTPPSLAPSSASRPLVKRSRALSSRFRTKRRGISLQVDIKQNRRPCPTWRGRLQFLNQVGEIGGQILFFAFAANEGNPISTETWVTHDCIWDARSRRREADRWIGTRDYPEDILSIHIFPFPPSFFSR